MNRSSILDPAELVTYSQTTSSGRTFRCSRRTAAHLDFTKRRLAQHHPGARLVVIQGCYNQGVAASAGTHDYDAVLDVQIVGLDWWAAQRFLRECGWAAWYRHTGAWSSPSAWHIHMVSLGYTTHVGVFVPGQVDDYHRHALGLKGQHDSGSDDSWFPPDIAATIFDFALWERELEDDMAWRDWPKEDRAAAAQEIAAETVKQLLAAVVAEGKVSVQQTLKRLVAFMKRSNP